MVSAFDVSSQVKRTAATRVSRLSCHWSLECVAFDSPPTHPSSECACLGAGLRYSWLGRSCMRCFRFATHPPVFWVYLSWYMVLAFVALGRTPFKKQTPSPLVWVFSEKETEIRQKHTGLTRFTMIRHDEGNMGLRLDKMRARASSLTPWPASRKLEGAGNRHIGSSQWNK